jgi:hypothetical protein
MLADVCFSWPFSPYLRLLASYVYDSTPEAAPQLVLPVCGSEPMLNLNRTRTGPHVRFGVQQILDFAEPNIFEPIG